MTLEDFYKYACLAAKYRGFDVPKDIKVNAVIHGGIVFYSATIWINKKQVYGSLQKNPVAAIRAFKHSINFYKHEYSQQSEDITL